MAIFLTIVGVVIWLFYEMYQKEQQDMKREVEKSNRKDFVSDDSYEYGAKIVGDNDEFIKAFVSWLSGMKVEDVSSAEKFLSTKSIDFKKGFIINGTINLSVMYSASPDRPIHLQIIVFPESVTTRIGRLFVLALPPWENNLIDHSFVEQHPDYELIESLAKPREGRPPCRPRTRQSASLPCQCGGFASASIDNGMSKGMSIRETRILDLYLISNPNEYFIAICNEFKRFVSDVSEYMALKGFSVL